jgi:hypothetical protein
MAGAEEDLLERSRVSCVRARAEAAALTERDRGQDFSSVPAG